jgi:hypothetical protein
MTAYSDRVIRVTQQVLLEVFQLLEKFHESLILIGGWVPIMMIPDGVDIVAQEFLPHLKKASVKNALTLLSRYFKSIQARGPTDVVSEEGTTDQDYKEFLRQDAFQRVQALLKSLDFEMSN